MPDLDKKINSSSKKLYESILSPDADLSLIALRRVKRQRVNSFASHKIKRIAQSVS
jgi:hypothetical protein